MISDAAALAPAFFALVPSPIPAELLRAPQFRLGNVVPYPGEEVDTAIHRHITCRDWMNLSRFGKMNLVDNIWGASRVFVGPDGNLLRMSQTQIVAEIDAYCLRLAIEAQNRARSASPGRVPGATPPASADTAEAQFLSRAGYTCSTWVTLSRDRKRAEVYSTLTTGKTLKERFAVSQNPADFGTVTFPGMYDESDRRIRVIDAYCTPRSASPGRVPTRPAGEVSLPQGGAQWGGLAFITAMFGLFYWGLRAESPEEKAAYDAMKAARHNPSDVSVVHRRTIAGDAPKRLEDNLIQALMAEINKRGLWDPSLRIRRQHGRYVSIDSDRLGEALYSRGREVANRLRDIAKSHGYVLASTGSFGASFAPWVENNMYEKALAGNGLR